MNARQWCPRLAARLCALTLFCLSSGGHAAAGTAALRPPVDPDTFPSLLGAYQSSSEHPRVFMTPAYLRELVARINAPGSYSALAFRHLWQQIRADLAAKTAWGAAYSGCDVDVYLRAFSFESRGGYSDQVRSEAQLSEALGVNSGLRAPAGAAVAAARLALYASLVKLGAPMKPGMPTAEAAAALSRQILLAWANHGFRDRSGKYLSAAEQFCDGRGEPNRIVQYGVGLQIGRGIIYSVQAQDLLQGISAIDSADVAQLSRFHAGMFHLIHEALNFRFVLAHGPDSLCEVYNNQAGIHLIGLLSIARLLDNQQWFEAVLNGRDGAVPMSIWWTDYFNRAIYGEDDKPIHCFNNSGPDSLRSRPSFETAVAAPGEVEDRFRHGNPEQSFGYTTMVLDLLYKADDMLRNAGFNAYEYRGTHQQSLEMATQYYACYVQNVGTGNVTTAENGRPCPDFEEYIGQTFGAKLRDVMLMGAYHFPNNALILAQAAAAQQQEAPIDGIAFGRWQR